MIPTEHQRGFIHDDDGSVYDFDAICSETRILAARTRDPKRLAARVSSTIEQNACVSLDVTNCSWDDEYADDFWRTLFALTNSGDISFMFRLSGPRRNTQRIIEQAKRLCGLKARIPTAA